MALPRLIHPIQVTFQLFNQESMLMDEDAREPIHGARSQPGDTVSFPCQVSWTKFNDPRANIGGTSTEFIGYFLARAHDMDQFLPDRANVGKRLKRGDYVVSYTSKGPVFEVVPCKLFILRGEPFGHYPERGATLYKYHVTDRDPVH
jgi:hypothetical protein